MILLVYETVNVFALKKIVFIVKKLNKKRMNAAEFK